MPQEVSLADLAARVETLEAKLTIIELLGRYGRALDEEDWDELRQLIAPDVRARHDAVAPPLEGIESMLAVINAALPKLKKVQHFISNQHVDVHEGGQEATAHAFVFAMHDTGVDGDGGALVPAGAAYRMGLRRADTRYGWQIHTLDVNETWWDPGIRDIYDQTTV